MHILLLISKYLRRKLAPIFAALAVTLCTAMVIIVISVMGGFLDLMKTSARKLSADVSIRADLYGMPHYDALIEQLVATPEIAGATPVIQGYGLIKLNGFVHPIEVVGIRAQGYNQAANYHDTLYWTKQDITDYLNRTLNENDYDINNPEVTQRLAAFRKRVESMDPVEWGMNFELPEFWAPPPPHHTPPPTPQRSGVVIGIHVNPNSRRDEQGQYNIDNYSIFQDATLTVVPISQAGDMIDRSSQAFTVVNEFKSGLYEIDSNRVYVSFAVLQKMLWMESTSLDDPETGEPTGKIAPARASRILVTAADGVDVAVLKKVVDDINLKFRLSHKDMPYTLVETWYEQHGTFLGAIEKEKILVTFLFAIISVVAFAMIAVIFYMIVLEKTRDIGILRALGASRRGIAAIFLGYGLTIGIIGAGLGLLISALIVGNINEIQDWLTRSIGFTMWNPSVYYFDRIPGKLDPTETTVIMVAAVACSLLGSAIPAWLASRVDPVESLRYE